MTTHSFAPPYAGYGRRLYAFFIDQSAIQLVTVIVTLPFGANVWKQMSDAFNLALNMGMSGVIPDEGSFGNMETMLAEIATAIFIFIVVQFFVAVFYGALMESSAWGATLGKRYCGLCVTNTYGGRIGLGAAAVRNIGINLLGVALSIDMIFFLALMPAYLMPLVMPRRQALHDLIAQTVVVQVK